MLTLNSAPDTVFKEAHFHQYTHTTSEGNKKAVEEVLIDCGHNLMDREEKQLIFINWVFSSTGPF